MERNIFRFVYAVRSFSLKEKVIFFCLGFILIVSLSVGLWKLSNLFLKEVPADGGTISEGIIGTPRFINPLLAISDADRDMTTLIYSGLMRPDNDGNLIPDLAEKVDVSSDGLTYTFTLKPDLKWQDGKPLTSEDIIFTVEQTKDSFLKSPKRANWEGVDVEAVNDATIKFTLKKAYTPFLENATMGILPKHIWQGATSDKMIFSEFNINPVGSGPYKIKNIERNSSGIVTSYELSANSDFALDKPHISNIIMNFYPSETELISAFQKGEVSNINALAPSQVKDVNKNGEILKTLFLPRTFAVFFNQNNAKIFSQKEVRDALNTATDKEKIINDVLLGYGSRLDYSIPPGSFGDLNSTTTNTFSIEKAKQILKNNGWVFNEKDQIWEKKFKKETLKLEFSLETSDAADLKQTAEILKNDWTAMGAKVDLKIFEIGDLNQNIIRSRKYDALLFGEVVGRDPDPFAFWHSSQRNDPGLNIALYTNPKVDKILEEARAETNDKKREQDYENFQTEMIKDTPAIFLFSPKFLYLMSDKIMGTENMKSITIASERFSQVYNWYLKTDKVWKIFAPKEN